MEPQKSNILIVDDEKFMCEVISQVIEKEGHTPLCALTLAEGLALLRSGISIDAVFLDVRLPDANGLDHIGEFLQNPSLPEVIIITGFGTPEGAELALGSGALDYVEKPCTAACIILRLRRALERHKQKVFWFKIKEAFTKLE